MATPQKLTLKKGRYTARRPALDERGKPMRGSFTVELRKGDALPEEFVAHLPEADRELFDAAPSPKADGEKAPAK